LLLKDKIHYLIEQKHRGCCLCFSLVRIRF